MAARPAPLVPDLLSMMIVVRIDQPVLQQWRQGQGGAGRVAAGVGDQPCSPHPFPVQFGKSVDRLGQQFRRLVRFVPLGIDGGIVQPVVGGQIDHPAAGRQQSRHHRHRRLVRHGGKDQIGTTGKGRRFDGLEGQVEDPGKRRKDVTQRLAGLLPRGHAGDGHCRVPGQQAQQFHPGVTAGADDGDSCAWQTPLARPKSGGRVFRHADR